MADFYDRAAHPMTMQEWSEKLGDMAYRRVAETTLPNGKWVSTIWLGLNHRFSPGLPLIFETMVFKSKGEFGELDSDRYSFEEDALAGHQVMCEKWKDAQGQSCRNEASHETNLGRDSVPD